MNRFPEFKLKHLYNLTDCTGIFQHARYQIPDRNHGYCLDDNVRAILVLVLYARLYGRNAKVDHLMGVYLSFVDFAYNEKNKKFRNFMSYNREWLEAEGSEDSQGRTIWALGVLANDENFEDFQPFLEKLWKSAVQIPLKSPKAIAFSLLGLTQFSQETEYCGIFISELIKVKTKKLLSYFENKEKDWPWWHWEITYDSGRIPQALIRAGVFLKNEFIQEKGQNLLDWLMKYQFEKRVFVPVGNSKWMNQKEKSLFDQQPLEASAMVDACLDAGNYFENPNYFKYAEIAYDWFLGRNLIGKSLYDSKSGGCCDGLHPGGVNANQGAESTLAWLSSTLRMRLQKRNWMDKKQVEYESLQIENKT